MLYVILSVSLILQVDSPPVHFFLVQPLEINVVALSYHVN